MKLTYQDCKELKDAGFPQREGHLVCEHGEHITKLGACKTYYEPSFSELLELCGDKFTLLEKTKMRWWACGCARENDGTLKHKKETDFAGASPEQAVKNLWVALNHLEGGHTKI